MSKRRVTAKVELAPQQMTPGFRAYGLRAGGPVTLDPFLNLDDFTMSQPTFPPHPHAGFSAITYMFEDSAGAFINRDSLGDRSRIEPGAFHWTQAGRGMMHEEVPEHPGVSCHGLQMFVNLREADKLAAPRAFHLAAHEVPEVHRRGARVRVLAGAFETTHSPLTELLTPVTFLDVHLDPDATFELAIPSGHTAFALAVTGRGEVDDGVFEAHSAVGFSTEGDLVITGRGERPFQVLVGAGVPLRERVVARGPFVMNDLDAIRAAEERFRGGGMGQLAPSF